MGSPARFDGPMVGRDDIWLDKWLCPGLGCTGHQAKLGRQTQTFAWESAGNIRNYETLNLIKDLHGSSATKILKVLGRADIGGPSEGEVGGGGLRKLGQVDWRCHRVLATRNKHRKVFGTSSMI